MQVPLNLLFENNDSVLYQTNPLVVYRVNHRLDLKGGRERQGIVFFVTNVADLRPTGWIEVVLLERLAKTVRDEALKDLVSERNLEERVEFSGSVADITPHLVWADLLLLTSKTEGLPGVLIEAAAAGVPSIAYDVGAIDEVVENGSSGIVVGDRTVESAARALIMLAGDGDLLHRLGARGGHWSG